MDGRLFEAGRLSTFSAFRMGAHDSRWALIRGWALNRINTVYTDGWLDRSTDG